ncbi:MAG: protein kinase [Planctomycetota bacterium]|nr:protein kinase [Planctomycetota bacterium]
MSDLEPQSAEDALELFLARRRRGERVEAADFAAQFAHLGSEVRDALDALLELERENGGAEVADEALTGVGPYRIVREIGRGGMGVVFEAIEQPLGRRVALKVLPSHALQSPAALARFRREAELAARLDHPGIATIYGTGVAGDRPWIAMRYVDGETLASSIARARESAASCARISDAPTRGRESVLAVAACIARIARALQAAHAQGVIHRDVKPSNVIVGSEGGPVLVDFGLAIPEEATGASVTRTGDTAGTPAYIAPELVSGERVRPDAQSDVYALGVTLYECLSLRRPFDGPTPVALYRAIATSSATDIRSLNPVVPRDLAIVAATAMERDRGRRYATAAALAEDLEACVAQRPIRARPLPLYGRVLRWARREPRQAALAAALSACVIALAVFGGNWWATRDEVRAAASFARTRASEVALEDGFASLDRLRTLEADAAFARALEFDPENEEAVAGHVLSSILAGDFARALGRLSDLSPSMRGRDALEALANGRPLPPRSAADFAPDVRAFELYILGRCVAVAGQRQSYYERRPASVRAFELFSEAVARAPVARAIYHQQRASSAQQVGDAQAARSASAALVSLWPDSARALYYAGQALVLIDPAAARVLLERSLERDPNSADTYNLIVQTLAGPDDLELAEAWCWRGLARQPRAAALYVLMANSLTQRGCTDESNHAYERAVEIDPRLGGGWAQLGIAALLQDDVEAALAHYARAFAVDPLNYNARAFHAAVLERHGDVEASAREADFAIAGAYPAQPAYWAQLSSVFLQLRAHHTAVAYADVGLALAPGDPDLAMVREAALDALSK